MVTGGAAAAFYLDHRVRTTRQLGSTTQTARAFGTKVSITALHQDESLAKTALGRAFDELKLIEDLMSVYRPESQVSRLNREGGLDDPHPYLVEVLQAAKDMSIRSGGAFDITVQPLWQLYADAHQRGSVPTPGAIANTRQNVDWRRVHISDRRVRLKGQGTQITLNGIAQGFAADKVAYVLHKHGVLQALIDTGEINARGTNRKCDPWTIGIQHPRRAARFVAFARLADRCLSTSGDYATSFTSDYRHHHLFDPRRGRSPEELASVSVVAGSAMQADALSTAVFVLGPEKGLALIRSLPGADALLITKEGTLLATAGFPLES